MPSPPTASPPANGCGTSRCRPPRSLRPSGSEGLEDRIASVDDVRGPGHGLPYPLPAGAALGVVELDAHPEKLLPDLVGAGEVSTLPGGLALGDQSFDLGIDHRRKLDDIENPVRVTEHRHRRGTLLSCRLS